MTENAMREETTGVASSSEPGSGRLRCDIERADFGDLLAGLAPGSVDLVLTDPPYAISRKTGFANVGEGGVERFAVSMEFGDWDLAEIDLARLAEGMRAALRPGGTALVFYDLWKITNLKAALEGAGFRMLRLVQWQKTNPVPLNQKATYLSNSREVAVSAVKGGRPTFHGEYDDGVYRMPIPRHGGRRVHPTQKPQALFEALVRKHSNPGDLVVDPFLGSGTCAAAALATGRAFAGGDIDAGYVRLARERVAGGEAASADLPGPCPAVCAGGA